MIGRFTEVKEMEAIKGHLMHSRIVFAFTGKCFLLLAYNCGDEIGIIKSYDILNNMKLESKQYNLIEFIATIKLNIEDNKYHYLLYYGDLNINNSIYDFMKEFYNPIEELPIVVSTAVIDEDNIRSVVSYSGNIQSNISKYIDKFNTNLMESYASLDLGYKIGESFNTFSIWLCKNGKNFKMEFRSKYFEYIEKDNKLREEKNNLIQQLDIEMHRLGIA